MEFSWCRSHDVFPCVHITVRRYVNPKIVPVKVDWKWKSVVGDIGYKFKTTSFRLMSLFVRYFCSADNVLVNLFTMMPVERCNAGPAHRLCYYMRCNCTLKMVLEMTCYNSLTYLTSGEHTVDA
jgi:hypothetical protein